MRWPRSRADFAVTFASMAFAAAVLAPILVAGHAATDAQRQSCKAVDLSNANNYKLWHDAISTGPRAHDPAVLDFLARYRQNNRDIHDLCRGIPVTTTTVRR